MKYKIPKFVTRLFNHKGNKEEKDKLVSRLNDFHHNELTKELIKYLEQEVEKEVLEVESSTFISLFQSKYHTALSRGKRTAYRNIINQLRSDDV